MQSTKHPKRHFLTREHMVLIAISCVSILIIVAVWQWYAGRIDAIEQRLEKPAETELLYKEN